MVVPLGVVVLLFLGWQFLSERQAGPVVETRLGKTTPPAQAEPVVAGPSEVEGDESESSRKGLHLVEERPVGGKQVVVHDPCRLVGRVVRAVDGEPVPGAKVELVYRDADSFWNIDLEYGERIQTLAETKSDDEGRFGFDVVWGRLHRVRASKDGFAPGTVLEVIGGGEVVIPLSPGALVRGRVTGKGDGKPIAGAEIYVYMTASTQVIGKAVSGRDGCYEIPDLPAIPAEVRCYPSGLDPPPRVNLDPVSGQRQVVDFEVDPGRILKGTVSDRVSGKPIVGARVSTSCLFRSSVLTDGSGSFEIVQHPVSGQIYVRAEGYAEEGIASPEGNDRLDVTLLRAGSVKGRIIGPGGAGLGSAYVVAGVEYSSRKGIGETDLRRAEVDGNGFFLAEGLHPERLYSLYIRAEGCGTRLYRLPRAVASGEVFDAGDFRMLEGGGIEGRVVDKGGQPIGGITVSLGGHNADTDRLMARAPAVAEVKDADRKVIQFEVRSTRSASDGSFRFDRVSAGTYRLRVRRRNGNPIELDGVEVRDGEITRGIELRYSEGLVISGRVVRADKEALPDLGSLGLFVNGPGNPRIAGVEPDGRFRLIGLERGSYTISATTAPEGFAALPVHDIAAGTSDVEIVLARADRIGGRVVDEDGKPIPGALVGAQTRGGAPLSNAARSDDKGRFSVTVPSTFIGVLSVSIPGDYTRFASARDVPAGKLDVELVVK
ncbi:MAG: carboxypeptidase regulatory-like domain-containing protein [Planctomycetota bacterium]